MNRARVLQERRIMLFEEIYQWQSERRLINEDAAEMLGVCAHTYRQRCRRYEDEGSAGLLDGRLTNEGIGFDRYQDKRRSESL